MPCRNSTARRKVIKRACDACKIRKIKCSELPPCGGCAASGISCTFRKTPSTRGPRNLRPKTISQISKRQKQYAGPDSRDNPPSSYFARDASSTPSNTVENQLRLNQPLQCTWSMLMIGLANPPSEPPLPHLYFAYAYTGFDCSQFGQSWQRKI